MEPGNSKYLLEEMVLLRNRVELLQNILKINNINPAIEQIKKKKQLDKIQNFTIKTNNQY